MELKRNKQFVLGKSNVVLIFCATVIALFFSVISVKAQVKTVTFTPESVYGSNTSVKNLPDTITQGNVTIIATNSAFKYKSAYRLGKGSTVTFSVKCGRINEVLLTFLNNSNIGNQGNYSLDNKDATLGRWAGNATSFSLGATNGAFISKIVVTYDPNGKITPTTLTFEDPSDRVFLYNQKEGREFTNKAILSPTIKGAKITYSSTNSSVAILDPGNKVGKIFVNTGRKAGETTITARFAGNDYYEPSTASYVIRVLPQLTGNGTKDNPYTVNDVSIWSGANALPNTNVYVKGIVGGVLTSSEDEKCSDYVVVDKLGDTSLLEIHGGKYLNNMDFTSAEQLKEGDQVVIYGKLSSSQDPKTENKIVEVVKGNYIAKFWGNELTIDEEKEKNEVTGDMRHATLKLRRKFNKNAWNSLVLPFDMTAEQVQQTFGESTQLAEYVGTTENSDGSFTLNFDETTNITANTPVFVYGANPTVDKTIEDVFVEKGTAELTPSGATFAFTGSYDKMSLRANDWFISQDNNFYLATGGEKMKGTRAVFRPVKSVTAPQSLKTNLVERPTGIATANVDLNAANSFIYNLSGQRVSDSCRGVVIKDGKKYVKP